ncbi:DNA replication/repair protein RecF [Kaarinaea lacus]
MAIEQLDILQFRNLTEVRIKPSLLLNFIVGKNGSGKTSLLEAIYYLGSARSFRTPHSKQLIAMGESQFSLFAKITHRDASLGIGISKTPQSVKIKIANSVVTNASQLAELLPVQLINPDVHKMMEEGPRHRRRFIEWGVFHVKPNYLSDWQQCRHVLKQRNAALKHGLSTNELRYWNDSLVEISESISVTREEYLAQLQPFLDQLICGVPGLPKITIKLDRGWTAQKSLQEVLEDSIRGDRKRGFTQFGAHRADLQILAGEMRAKDVVSRGQQKMLTAMMKIAQVNCLRKSGQGANIVLLVDDLPAELDSDYRQHLINIIVQANVQTFITATDLEMLIKNVPDSAEVFHVEHGSFRLHHEAG